MTARDELHKIADVVEPHWKGAGMPLKAEWIIKEYCHLGSELTKEREKNEALVKERDDLKTIIDSDDPIWKTTFQRGREAGIRDAAQTARRYTVVADQKFDDVLAKAQAGVKNLSLAGACATGMMHMAEGIERAILALIDKQENEQ